MSFFIRIFTNKSMPKEMSIEEMTENIKRNLQSVPTTTTKTISDNLKNVATWGQNKGIEELEK